MAPQPVKPHLHYIELGPFPTRLAVAFDDKSFQKELKRLGVEGSYTFLDDCHACVYRFGTKTGTVIIMAFQIRHPEYKTKLALHALIAHEAVHVIQALRERMSERSMGDETEAYTLEYIVNEVGQLYEKVAKDV